MKRNVRSCIIIWAAMLLAALFCLIMTLVGRNPVKAAKTEAVTDERGREFYAVCISDLDDINTLPYVNYVPDEFVSPGDYENMGEVVPVNGKTPLAQRGTLKFVVLNLNPEDENFIEKAEALASRLEGDNYWHFTLYLPQVFSACNVYVNGILESRTGQIENYDFIEHCDYSGVTEQHKDGTRTQYIDLRFYPSRRALSPEVRIRGVQVTVHYETQPGLSAGLYELPLIGTESSVRTVEDGNKAILYAMVVLSAIVFSAFVFVCILKRSAAIALQLVFAASVFITVLATYLLISPSSLPFLLLSLRKAALGMCLVAACFNLPKFIFKVPVRYISTGISVAASALAFCVPVVPFAVAAAFTISYKVLAAVMSAAVMAATTYCVYKNGNASKYINNSIAVTLVVFGAFFTRRYVNMYFSPALWLCLFILAVITVVGLREFVSMEKQNRYLTSNLHMEVDRQLKDLKAVITERDNLLQFVSHDMKKPLTAASAMLDTLISREKDGEQIKALGIVKQNTGRVVRNLSEISSYARFNYIAEPSHVIDLNELCDFVCDFHNPDCNANGIVLKNSVDKHFKVFVKRQGLENAMSNIILNAIEHANCKTITISAKSEKQRVVLSIADDGKGISENVDIFKAYVSENKPETGGVGLYICKNIIESMNGELTYESTKGNTVFHISLLKS